MPNNMKYDQVSAKATGSGKKKGAAESDYLSEAGDVAAETAQKNEGAPPRKKGSAKKDPKKIATKIAKGKAKAEAKKGAVKKDVMMDEKPVARKKGGAKHIDGKEHGAANYEEGYAPAGSGKKKGASKKKGAALISGKKPKAKGQTTPNTNRLAKTPLDKVTDFAKGFVSHLGQSVSNDFNTIKNAVTGSGKHNGAGKIGGFTQNFGPARQNSYAKGAARVAQIMGKGAADVIDGSTHKHPHVTMSQDPVVIGDASKINTTVTSTKGLPLSVHDQNSPQFKRNLGQANKDMRNFENRNMSQVNIDKKKNIILQEKEKRDGMDYQANTGTDNQKTIRRS